MDDQHSEVPEEIQDYYKTERRERAGVAWLLAFGTLIVTVLLAGGIFFGGRWAYRKIAGDDTKTETPSEIAQKDQEQKAATPAEQSQPASADKSQASDQNKDTAPAATPGTQQESNSAASEGSQAPATGSSSQSSSASSSQGTVNGATSDLPNTGPGNYLYIFFAVSVLGYLSHRMYTRFATAKVRV